MKRLFSTLVSKHTPPMNELIMNGLSLAYVDKVEEYIDRVIKTATTNKDIIYMGYERCTPHEEFKEITKLRNNKRTFDVSKSDLYLVKYSFSFKGIELPPKYIYLPFIREAGIINLNGVKYHIIPVLADKVITPNFSNIFVRLLRYKVIFNRLSYSVIINDSRDTYNVIWSNIYRKATKKKIPITTKAVSSVVHYLLAKYGMNDMFEKYAGFVPVVGLEEINKETYPPKDWVICRSTKVKPKRYMGDYSVHCNIRLAIPVNMWNHITKSLVVGFFYIADHFPERVTPDMINKVSIWRILLGHILFSGVYGENKLYMDITEHLCTLDEYVDVIVKERLIESGYNIDNFYDLMAMLNSEFTNFVLNNDSNSLNMYGKGLEILYYVLYEITSSIFNVNFKLNKSRGDSPLSINNVKEIFNKMFRTRAIKALGSSICADVVSCSGDNMYFKLTSRMIEQENGVNKTGSKNKKVSLDESKYIHPSMLEVGNFLCLFKSNPSAVNRVNPYIIFDLNLGVIVPNEKFDKIRLTVGNKLKGIGK